MVGGSADDRLIRSIRQTLGVPDLTGFRFFPDAALDLPSCVIARHRHHSAARRRGLITGDRTSAVRAINAASGFGADGGLLNIFKSRRLRRCA